MSLQTPNRSSINPSPLPRFPTRPRSPSKTKLSVWLSVPVSFRLCAVVCHVCRSSVSFSFLHGVFFLDVVLRLFFLPSLFHAFWFACVFYLFFMCVDGGGNVRRHGDRAHAGRQGPNPRTEAHPSPAEGTPGALLGRPLHRTVRGKRPAETPLLYTTPSWVFVLNHSTYEGLGMHQQNNQNSRLTPTYQ